MKTILVVEDDKKLNEGICLALKSPDISVCRCSSMEEAREYIGAEDFDLMLLDINLPDGDGMEILRELREAGNGMPVIIITANNMETDIVAGLELGANDYITKPFSLMVLRARVNVQLRERKKAEVNVFESPGLFFDFDRMLFTVYGKSTELSKTEQKLLKALVENKGMVLTRNQLIDRIWSEEGEFVDEHALTVNVKRLRDKIRSAQTGKDHIRTVYGIGYVWEV